MTLDGDLISAAVELLLMRDATLTPVMRATGDIEIEGHLADAREAARDYLVKAFAYAGSDEG